MEIFKNQIIGGTSLDTQGERLSKDFLDHLAKKYHGKKMPMHIMHDMAHPSRGYSENIRVVESDVAAGEWNLVADITVEAGVLGDFLKGFSISFTEVTRNVKGASLGIFLPYPHYNDNEFMSKLISNSDFVVGKWVKKSADPATVAIIVSVVAFILRPAWDSYYKDVVAPQLHRFLELFGSSFLEKKIVCELVQFVEFDERKVEIRFLPPPNLDHLNISSDVIKNGISMVENFLMENREKNIIRVVLAYDLTGRCYYVSRNEEILE